MIVVDSNILAYLYIPGEFTHKAEQLLEAQPEWSAPVLWRSEFRNILAGYVRRNQLKIEEAIAIQLEAENLMASGERSVDSIAVLHLVAKSDCSAYDCEFIAAAQSIGTKFVTMDRKLLKAFPKIAISLHSAV